MYPKNKQTNKDMYSQYKDRTIRARDDPESSGSDLPAVETRPHIGKHDRQCSEV